jgi:hypothetical protein
MIKNAINGMKTAARCLFSDWHMAAVFAGLYATLLAALHLFVTTREARIWHVLLTLALALVVPVLFFVLQAMSVYYTENGAVVPGNLLRRSFRNFWKLLLVSLPLILLAGLLLYLQHKYLPFSTGVIKQAALPVPAQEMWPPPNQSSAAAPSASSQWLSLMLATLRFLLFAVALPLMAIHLWITTAQAGLKSTIRRARQTLAHSLSPQSVLIYTFGLIVFGIIPYVLLFTRTPARNAWIEIGLFNLRLALVFILTLTGWVLTLGALKEGMRNE